MLFYQCREEVLLSLFKIFKIKSEEVPKRLCSQFYAVSKVFIAHILILQHLVRE